MMSNKLPPYWPNIKITPGANSLMYETTVRIQQDSVWYDNVIREFSHGPTPYHDPHQGSTSVPIGVPVDYERDLIQRFLVDVSMVQNFIKVDLNIVDADKNPIFKPSDDQRDEKERLMSLHKEIFGL